MVKYLIDILNDKRKEADGYIDKFLSKYKWPMTRYVFTATAFTALGYWLHMNLTNETGAALRGTMFAM